MRRTVVAALTVAAVLAVVAGGLGGPSGLGPHELAQHMDEQVIKKAVNNPDEYLFGSWHGDVDTGEGEWGPAAGGWGNVTPSANDRILTIQIKPDICLVGRMDLSGPEGWTLDLSNSPTANGYGGDAGTTDFDSEFELKNRRLGIYGNGIAYDDRAEYGEVAQYKYRGFLYQKRSQVLFAICDDKILVKSTGPQGPSNEVFHATEFNDDPGDGVIRYGGLFNLGPHDDGMQEQENGDPPFVLYMGLNRTVNDPARTGHGLVALDLYALPSPIPGD